MFKTMFSLYWYNFDLAAKLLRFKIIYTAPEHDFSIEGMEGTSVTVQQEKTDLLHFIMDPNFTSKVQCKKGVRCILQMGESSTINSSTISQNHTSKGT